MREQTLHRLILVVLAALLPCAAHAQPRTPAELIEENRALRDELEKAHSRVAALEAEVDRLLAERRGIEGTLARAESLISSIRRSVGSTDIPRPPKTYAQIPDDPLASPASLLRELQSRYHVEMLGVPTTTDAEREDFVRRAKLWCRLTNENLRGRRTWLVTLDDLAPMGRDTYVVRMESQDPESGLPIGEPFDVQFPKRFLDQFERGTKSGKWEVTSIVIAKPVFNESRLTRGVFEYPTMIGPMVEFDFELNWQGLRAWTPEPVEGADEEAQPEAVEEESASEEPNE
ncbi:MAG: hypothetical protein Phyf2KO_14170 [Phycisphaerales bacterium]